MCWKGRETCLIWSFCPLFRRSTPHSSPSQTPVRQTRASGRAGGGKGRNPDVLMEIQLSKVKLIFPGIKYSCWYAHQITKKPVYQLFFDLFLRWDFNMRCTSRSRCLQGQQRTSQCPGRCLLCRTWRFETDWLPLRWTSSSTCTPARRCPERPILIW